MAKYLGIIIGSIVLLAGLKGIWCWRADFLTVFKGFIPVVLILTGAIAVIAGISQIRDEASSRKGEERAAK